MTRAVTSLANPTVKAARALHMRKAREESGQFLAEGLKIVTEAVELGRAPRTLLFSADAAAHPLLRRAVAATEAAGGEPIEVSRAVEAHLAVGHRALEAADIVVHNLDHVLGAESARLSTSRRNACGVCAR